jgi:hypothetical protein
VLGSSLQWLTAKTNLTTEAALAHNKYWIVAAALCAATAAQAAEVCVSCAQPAARYRCVLADGETRSLNDAALQVLCIKELAARGQHARCSFDRTQANQQCDAPVAAVTIPAGLAIGPAPALIEGRAPAAPKSTAAAGPAPEPAAVAPPSGIKQPPETMEELAKQTAEQSKADWQKANEQVKETTQAAGRQVEKAGSAVGSAVKKSWDCVASFFSKC